MLNLIRRQPEEPKNKPNVFKEIYEEPWWRRWVDAVAFVAGMLAIGEAFIRFVFG